MDQSTRLVQAAQKGDSHAFARLYEGIYKDLYKFALYTLRNPEDAEDAVSEAVTDAFVSIGKLREAGAFRAWMFRILSNKCKNRLKEYRYQTVDWEEAEEELPRQSEDLAGNLFLRRIFGELEDEERLIISLHVFGGYTSREIGRMLSMNANTVRTRESRALRKLALRLSGAERDGK